MALLGPNGAGKSTTIRTLTTLCGFDSGKVLVAGFDVDRDPEKVRQRIGLVAQNTGIDYFLTGRENLELQGHLYRMPKADIKARVAELAGYFELDAGLDRQVATYSGGMRRKLDIATALIHRPSLLFLDEPTLGLDIKSRKMLWSYIQKLNRETGLTILLTTHYLEEADKLAHRVAIISAGKIRALGTPDELKGKIAGDALTLHLEQQDWTAQQFVTALNQTDYVKDVMWEGNKLHLYVTHGTESIPKIAELANQHGVHVLSLSLSRPSLDDVFLKYTGASMEDSEEESGDEWWKQWAGKGGGGKWQQQWSENQAADDNGGQSAGDWQTDQWRHDANQDPDTSSQEHRTNSADDAANPQQPWSPEEMAQWQDQRRTDDSESKSSTADDDQTISESNDHQPSWPGKGKDKSWNNDTAASSDSNKTTSPRTAAGGPAQQDWLNEGAQGPWPNKDKWTGNPSKK